MAGAKFDHKGGGANQLCLPLAPQYLPDTGTSEASIYGSEYRVWNSGIRRQDVLDRNIPCAVCRVQLRTSAIMVPARNTCLPGWTREYYGYLMAAHYTHGKNNHVCVDQQLTTLPGHAGYKGGNLLYVVSAPCGFGLDCPPYQDKKPLACAMCTI